MPSSWVNNECSIHRIQHTPKIVCCPFFLTISSWPLNEPSASGVPSYRSTATSMFSIRASNVKSPCHISTVGSYLTDELSRGALSIDRLQVLVQSRLITASKCISRLARLRPARSHDHWLQVDISRLARSRPPSVSPDLLDYVLPKCISKLARSWSRRASLSSLDRGLQVHLEICSITASKCISKVARSQPGSISLSSLDRHVQAHLQLLSSTACSQSRYSMCRWVAI